MRVLPWCLPVVSAMRSMLTALPVGLATVCWTSGTVHAQTGPSVLCPKPDNPLAELICSTPDLSQIDLSYVQVYQELRARLDPSAQEKLRQETVAFNPGQQYVLLLRDVMSRKKSAPAEEPAGLPQAHVAELQADLQRLQADLQRLGFLPPDAAIDGVFGPVTRKAIQQWQQSRGRPPTGLLAPGDRELIARQVASPYAPGTPTASSPVSPSEQDERQRAAETARRRLQQQAAEDKLNRNLKERGFQLVSPVDLNLDWRDFMANNTKVAVRGTYFHSHDVEALSTPENKDQPTIRLYTNDATRDARKLMLECRNSNFKYSLCEMIVGATIKQCIRNKGGLNEKEIPCLNVQEAYLVP